MAARPTEQLLVELTDSRGSSATRMHHRPPRPETHRFESLTVRLVGNGLKREGHLECAGISVPIVAVRNRYRLAAGEYEDVFAGL